MDQSFFPQTFLEKKHWKNMEKSFIPISKSSLSQFFPAISTILGRVSLEVFTASPWGKGFQLGEHLGDLNRVKTRSYLFLPWENTTFFCGRDVLKLERSPTSPLWIFYPKRSRKPMISWSPNLETRGNANETSLFHVESVLSNGSWNHPAVATLARNSWSERNLAKYLTIFWLSFHHHSPGDIPCRSKWTGGQEKRLPTKTQKTQTHSTKLRGFRGNS